MISSYEYTGLPGLYLILEGLLALLMGLDISLGLRLVSKVLMTK